ncbi:MAG: LysR substrate-binding domain-containing protein [Pyrinomonadaceae bacterium]
MLEHLPRDGSQSRTRRFEKGADVWRPDDRADSIFFLLSGQVAVIVGDVEGKEVALRVVEAGEPFGELCFCAGPSDFYVQFPTVKIDLRISDPKVVCNEVLSGEAELGFSCAKIDTIGLEFIPFASGGLALVVPNNGEWKRARRVTRERLAAEPFLTREPGSGMRTLVEEKLGCTLDQFNVVATFGSNGAVKEALKAGMGVAEVTLLSVKDEIASGEMKTVEIEGLDLSPSDYYTVTNKKLTLSPVAETFLACALETFREGTIGMELSA